MEQPKKYRYANRIPLFAQLIALMIFLIFLLILSVFGSIHKKAQSQIQTQMQISNQKLIRVELTNLDEYIDSIMNFCIQPCYDSTFYSYVQSKIPLSHLQINTMKNSMKNYYYSMTNIKGYQIYLLNQDIVLYRDSDSGQFIDRPLTADTVEKNYNDYLHSGNAYGIYETEDDDSFLNFYHSIIQIDNRKPQAIISVTVDTQFIHTLLENHTDHDEFICILNNKNQLLYSSNRSCIADADDLKTLFASPDRIRDEVEINGTRYCTQMESSKNYGLKIISCLPVTYFDSVTSDLLRSSLVVAITMCMAACVTVFVLIRLMTSPLSSFSKRLDQVAAGDYKSRLEMGGSSEIANLCKSFNSMISHIEELDKRSTIDEMKQKTASMRILNLSINPHYYYSVIQDIFVQASNNNDHKIMRMAQCVSNVMNYINNNIDFVTISDEIQDMNDILYLKEIHVEQPIRIEYQIPEYLYSYHIPKITFHVLTDPLIQYASAPEQQPLKLRISATEHDGSLYLMFEAVGYTISADFIAPYQATLPKIPMDRSYITGNPLLNLNERLYILYNNEFSLDFDVEDNQCSCIRLTVPTIFHNLYTDES